MAGGRTKSIRAGIVAALVAPLLSAGIAQAGTAHGAQAGTARGAQAGTAHVRISNTLAGQILTNDAGYVLLMFPREENSLTLCIRIRSCMRDWPPVTTMRPPVAGPGVDRNLLGTEPYRGKLMEVTYAGWPLHTYRFAFSARNSILDIGIRQFGDSWDALDPAGGFVT